MLDAINQEPRECSIEERQLALNGSVAEQTIGSLDAMLVGSTAGQRSSESSEPKLPARDNAGHASPDCVSPTPMNIAEAAIKQLL